MSYTRRTKDQLAARVAQDIPEGATVNLGIGQPQRSLPLRLRQMPLRTLRCARNILRLRLRRLRGR